MTVANAMVLVDQTAVPLALPSIMSEFGIDSQLAQWVLSASLLPLAGLLVLGGRLGDLLGRRRVFILGAVVFAGASALAGLSPGIELLLAFRVLQGAAGALMLPTTIAIVSASYFTKDRGRALGMMGGGAAVAGAFGPVLGGGLTSVFGWRSVLLINVPLALIAVAVARHAIRKDPPRRDQSPVDVAGATLLCLALVGLIVGLAQSQEWGWTSPGVLLSLTASAAAAAAFVFVERRTADPLMEFALLRRHRNYLAATISQAIGGMAEMGLGLILPLVLILNLSMDPGLAGLALIPTTLPMIVVAPLAGRWYDSVGGRMPLVVGFLLLAIAGVALAAGTALSSTSYWSLLPGLLVFGMGLAIVLTVNDPVSLDMVPVQHHGQASGVSATAEQFGGALGIAIFYLIFHATYVDRFVSNVSTSSLTDLSDAQMERFRQDIQDAEQTGLHPDTFDPALNAYLGAARDASYFGYTVVFILLSGLSIAAVIVMARLVRRPEPALEGDGATGSP